MSQATPVTESRFNRQCGNPGGGVVMARDKGRPLGPARRFGGEIYRFGSRMKGGGRGTAPRLGAFT